MTQFQASLIASGDPEPLPTTIELDAGKLVIQSNGQPLGDWPVSDLEFVRIVGGFRVTLDGEVTVLKLPDSDEFNAELRRLSEEGADPTARKREKKQRVAVRPTRAATPQAPAEAKKSADESKSTPSKGQGFVKWLDSRLDVAAKRGGKYLPEWVFTRGGVAVGVVFLIALILLPGMFSAIFLIVAAIGMLTSAVALMDQVIATRIFRGGITPIHGLIGSLALVLLGLVLAALA